jgi:hypothetical protein
MLSDMLLFGSLVGIAIVFRSRAEIHRPMMLLATVVIMSGSLGRFPYTSDLTVVPPLYSHGPLLLLRALLFFLQWAVNRAANRWYAIGYAGVAIVCLASVAAGQSASWNQIAGLAVP